jgi:PhnB protein
MWRKPLFVGLRPGTKELQMTDTVKKIPAPYGAVTPRLIIKGAADAIEFYKKAFGATELSRMSMPDGKIAHAEIDIGGSIVMLADEFEQYAHLGGRSPQTLGDSTSITCLYVEDVDAVAARAEAAGAVLLVPVSNQFYGDRSTRLRDPFGHLWMVSTHIEDVSPEEMSRRMQAFAKQ